jgi:hypothetical protein
MYNFGVLEPARLVVKTTQSQNPHAGRQAKMNETSEFRMINLTRFHVFRDGIFQIIDVEKERAEDKRTLLISEGYVICHVEEV